MYFLRMLSAFYPVHTDQEGRLPVCNSFILPRKVVSSLGLAPMRGPRFMSRLIHLRSTKAFD